MAKEKRGKKVREVEEVLPIYKTGIASALTNVRPLRYKNESQKIATELIQENTLTFLGGPAGSAKTFIAVAAMVQALKEERIKKVIISRPTVEAGETLGFLPGDIDAKLDPYIKPILHNLEYFVGTETANKMLEDKIIEIIPFQFMRGMTFQDAFIILDETQNATSTQLKLALTRIGFGSKCVVTYDENQIDIPVTESCVRDIASIFNRNQDGIGCFKFEKKDICRAPIVIKVLELYGGD